MDAATKVFSEIEKVTPVFHTRAMVKDFVDRAALLCPKKGKSVSCFQKLYRDLTGDNLILKFQAYM